MRKKCKSAATLALILTMAMAGSSMAYADTTVSAKTVDAVKEDETKEKPAKEAENEPALCNEGEHQLAESEVVLPTCTEKGYSIYRCKMDGCTYEEKRDETAALGHDLKEVSVEEATTDKAGSITYKCQRQGCDYVEVTEIPVKDPNASDDKEDDATSDLDTKQDDKSDSDNKTDTENGNHSNDKNDANSETEEELPDEDIDEEYAAYASSTSTDIVTEYDPETAVDTIRVTKKDSDNPTETEEVTGMTVPSGTTEIKKDADGNISDLSVSTAIEEIKNGFSLTSDNEKLHSISIIDKKNPKNHWITLSAKKTASELGIRLHNGDDKIIITLTENEKTLYITKISDTEKEIILTTSTGGTCVISKNLQKISTDKVDAKDGKIADKKNQIILNNTNGNKPYLELAYVKNEMETAGENTTETDALESKDSKTGDSETEVSKSNEKNDPDEELYWIRPYGDENQEPIVITIYKK